MSIDGILDYLATCFLTTGRQLLWLLSPLFVFALLMHYCSHLVRTRAATLLGTRCYVWLTCPGTIAHELGHVLFCWIFRHRILSVALFRPGNKGALGYVKHSYERRNLYQNVGNFFIGTGPIWFGSVLILLSIYWLAGPEVLEPFRIPWPNGDELQGWDGIITAASLAWKALNEAFTRLFVLERLSDWRFYLLIYLLFALGSHVTLSPEDLKGAGQGLLVGILLLLLFNLATLWYGSWFHAAGEWLLPELLMTGGVLLAVLAGNIVLAMVALLMVRD